MVVFYHVLYPGMLYQHVCLPVKVMPTFVFVHRLFFSFSFFPNRNLLTMGVLPTVLVNMRTIIGLGKMWQTHLICSFNHLVFLCFYDSCIAVSLSNFASLYHLTNSDILVEFFFPCNLEK
jgi:hypothetical protein